MDEILIKYILGETSAEENRTVEDWLQQDASHKKQLEQLKGIWAESKRLEVVSTVDEQTAWLRFQEKLANGGFTSDVVAPIEHQNGNTVAFEPKRKPMLSRVAAAAVLILTFGLGTYFYSSSKAEIVLAATDQVLTDTLPDHSVITLNKNAVLAYHKSFNKKNRKVELVGEAFFDVASNKAKPFEISVNDLVVHVVGTSFNIKSDEAATEVIVETGVVTVSNGNKSVKLLPHQRVRVGKDAKDLIVENTNDALYTYYRTQEFVCNNTPLYQLVDALNKSYNTRIRIANKSAEQLTLTSHFKKQQLNDILKVVAETFNLQIEQRDGEIVLK